VGAALVLLSNVRLYLDRVEAGLLDLAQQADMSWDLIAAILGIPAAEAISGVLVFRIATFWLPIPAGYLSYLWLRHRGTL
jgi:hypothetical protein